MSRNIQINRRQKRPCDGLTVPGSDLGGAGLEEVLFTRDVMSPSWPVTCTSDIVALAKAGEDEGSMTIRVQRMKTATFVASKHYFREMDPLKQFGLQYREADGALQSDDLGIAFGLTIVDPSSLPTMPQLRREVSKCTKVAMARSPQVLNEIRTDVTLASWTLADNAVVDGSLLPTQRAERPLEQRAAVCCPNMTHARYRRL